MGRIVERTYTAYELILSGEDTQRQRERMMRKREFPRPTKDMVSFCRRLYPCPICGGMPGILIVGDYGDYSMKLSCTNSPFHIACGGWHKTLAKAGKSWNHRTADEGQIRHSVDFEAYMASKRRSENGGSIDGKAD